LKFFLALILFFSLAHADDSNFCANYEQLKINMPVTDAIKLLGIPTQYSIPQHINIKDVLKQDKAEWDAKNVEQALQIHPIFSQYAQARISDKNTLIWNLSNKTRIMLRTKGQLIEEKSINVQCNAF